LRRFKLTLQYDGNQFQGWQIQKRGRTVQAELERVATLLNGNKSVTVVGAGRTDTGVHARAQVAHLDLETHLSPQALCKAFNGNLPEDLLVTDCAEVTIDFHARFSARWRQYRYRCRTDEELFDRHYVWRTGPLDVNRLNDIAKMVKGTHDFTSFSRYNPDVKGRDCTVYESQWREHGSIVNYYITANRFLHHMVRYLVGTMVAVSQKRFSSEAFLRLLEHPQEQVQIFKAPAQGLYLEQVIYD
jgi:tRNA pseudouridine38-40 synthase